MKIITSAEEQQRAAELQALRSQLAQKEADLQLAQHNWREWQKATEKAASDSVAKDARIKVLEEAYLNIEATLSRLAQVGSDGWGDFGPDMYFWLDSITFFKTKYHQSNSDDYASPYITSVVEINGFPIGYPYPLKDEVLAALHARRKARRGGGDAGASDLPVIPMPPKTPPDKGISRS